MTTQLLIYENAVPVSRGRHATWSVEVGADYAFSRRLNSIPLLAVEFPQAAAEYPIVFAGTDAAVTPAAVVGLAAEENMYLDDRGAWQARYVPAFVRRYPFVFSTADAGKTFTLCIDETFTGFNQEGRGQRLFDDAGTATPYVQNVLKFLQEYQVQFRRTEAFCAKLAALSVLEPMQAQITPPSGGRRALGGFSGVSRERLKALAGDALADLARTDELELAYLQMQSMRNFPRVLERGAAPAAPEEQETAPPAATSRGKPSARKK